MLAYQKPITYLDVDTLIERHQPGYSLEQAFYTDEDIFEEEFKYIISRQWQYTDHISRIPNKGDYFLFQIAGEEIIIMRGEGDIVYAHYNVCRHRGSRVCLEAEGNTTHLTCPYHAWSYHIDGSLTSARAMPNDFDPAQFGLRSCQVRLFEGFIFINLTAEGEGQVPDFSEISKALLPWVAEAGLRHTKIIGHENYRAPLNWKISLENYFECYHCVTSHPEFCKIQLHALRDGVGTEKASNTFAEYNTTWEAKAKALGHKVGPITTWNMNLSDEKAYNSQIFFAERMLVHYDVQTAYAKLKPDLPYLPGKLLGSYKAEDYGQIDWGILPSFFLYTFCTSTVVMRITPLGPLDTDITMTWLVHKDAIEGVDYNLESIIWLDHVTMIQDDKITKNTQAGVNSRAYTPGPYATLEKLIRDIHQNYLATLRYGRSLPS